MIAPDLDTLLRPPYIDLILGIIFFSAAVASTCTGKTYGGYGGWASRAEKPTQFWWGVAIYYLGGALCLGIYLHSVFPAIIFHPERWLQLK